MQFIKELTTVGYNDTPSRDGKVYAKATFTDGKDIIANVYVPTEYEDVVKNSIMQPAQVTIRIKQKDLGKVSISLAGITL